MSAVQVQEVIDDYVNLKRRGVNMIGLCPFHNEKTPSFTVSPAKNLYKCFGCGKGGGAINFLMEHESFTYPEALKYLANKYNIPVEEVEKTDEQIVEQQKRASLILINEMAAGYFQDQLKTPEGQSIGLSYFKHRGLNEKTIERYGLGYSPRDPKHFSQYATKKGHKVELLKELGLMSSHGNDFFRERVIFPFYNLSGKVIGFGGRILKENAKAPKYLNSPETEVYNKRKTLYGLYQARTDIRKADQCILVEGYTDVLSLHQSGFKNVVASSGTSLTIDQVSLIKRFTPNALVIYDGDQAGQKAALRGLDIFLEQGLNVKVVLLPEGQDPDSYVSTLGHEGFSTFLDQQAKDFILFRAQKISDLYQKDPVNKSIHTRELIGSLAKIRDQIKRSLYVKECAIILDIEEASLVAELNKNIRSDLHKQRNTPSYERRNEYTPKETKQNHSQQPKITVNSEAEYQERDIVRILICAGHQWYEEDKQISIGDYLMSNIEGVIDMFKDPACISVLSAYAHCKEHDVIVNHRYWAEHEDDHIRKLAIDFLSEKYTYAKWSEKGLELQTQKPLEENYIRDSYQSIMRFKLKMILERAAELQKMIEENHEEAKSLLLITAYQRLLKERQELANELNTINYNR